MFTNPGAKLVRNKTILKPFLGFYSDVCVRSLNVNRVHSQKNLNQPAKILTNRWFKYELTNCWLKALTNPSWLKFNQLCIKTLIKSWLKYFNQP